jgi:hypothetical protein
VTTTATESAAVRLPGEVGVRRVLAASVVVMVAFWAAWFGHRSLVASNTTRSYYDFENAFPLADAWLTVCLFGGLWTLRRQHPTALLWILLGAGGGIYLFAMDVLYDLEHGIWWKSGGGVVELGINLVTLAVSLGLLRWGWRHRDSLLRPGRR